MPDFILNGMAHGNVAQLLLANGFDPRAMRPWLGGPGNNVPYIAHNVAGKEVARMAYNADALLLKEEWMLLDSTLVKIARKRLKFINDLRAKGLTFSIGNGMAKTVLQTQRTGDMSDAHVSMDGISEGDNDKVVSDLVNLPLPIISKDFFFTAREIAVSREGRIPLDTTGLETAVRKVGEIAEKMAIGSWGTYTYGGGSIYGLTNFTDRLLKTITAPTASGWTPGKLVEEILNARQKAYDVNMYGPFAIYCSPKWDEYMDQDYSATKGDNTLRKRLADINGFEGVQTLDYMSNWDIVLVQTTTDVFREVIGMEPTIVQWPEKGGMQQRFKVMAIMVPQARSDKNSATGIVHCST